MGKAWHYSQDGQATGPVDEAVLKDLLASGRLGGDTLVWNDGMLTWAAARTIPELMQTPPAPQAPAPQILAPQEAPTPQARFPRPLPAPPTFSNPYGAPQVALEGGSRPILEGEVSPDVLELLRDTKPWARFLGVLGTIGSVFLILGGLGLSAVAMLQRGSLPGVFPVWMGLLYVVMAVLQLPPVVFLNRYASRIGDLLASGSPADLVEALRAQKSFWRYVGIFTLVLVIIYALAIAGAIIVAIVAATRRA